MHATACMNRGSTQVTMLITEGALLAYPACQQKYPYWKHSMAWHGTAALQQAHNFTYIIR